MKNQAAAAQGDMSSRSGRKIQLLMMYDCMMIVLLTINDLVLDFLTAHCLAGRPWDIASLISSPLTGGSIDMQDTLELDIPGGV